MPPKVHKLAPPAKGSPDVVSVKAIYGAVHAVYKQLRYDPRASNPASPMATEARAKLQLMGTMCMESYPNSVLPLIEIGGDVPRLGRLTGGASTLIEDEESKKHTREEMFQRALEGTLAAVALLGTRVTCVECLKFIPTGENDDVTVANVPPIGSLKFAIVTCADHRAQWQAKLRAILGFAPEAPHTADTPSKKKAAVAPAKVAPPPPATSNP